MLKAAQGGIGAWPQASVKSARRESVRCECELERGDVPASLPHDERARREFVPAIVAHGAASLPARDAVDGDVGAPLETADGRPRARAHDAVDRSVVEAAGVQRHLEGGNVG
jgi:hypothetical protein